jgi:RhoGAP domain
VFGVPLSTLAERCAVNGTDMPAIFTECLTFIEKEGGFSTQGIFRISGKKGTIRHLQSLYDRGLPLSLKQEDASVHDVASLVKLWLRKLPEPLFSFGLYQVMLDTFAVYEDNSDDTGLLANIAAKCRHLPLINRRLIVRLFDYLREASFHSEEVCESE